MLHPPAFPHILAFVLLIVFSSAACETMMISGTTRKWARLVIKAQTAASIGDYDRGRSSLEQALVLARELNESDPDKFPTIVVFTFDRLAVLSESMGYYPECERYARSSLQLREETQKDDPRGLSKSLNELAPCVARLGRVPEAQMLHARLVEIYRPTSEPHDLFLATSYRHMGEALLETSQPEAALPYFESSLMVRLWSKGSKRYDIAVTLDSYAEALRELGREADAAEAERRSAAILQGSDYYREAHSEYMNADQVWPDGPIRVHVERVRKSLYSDTKALEDATQRAIDAWRDVVEPGIPSFKFVRHRNRAQIAIRWVLDKGDRRWLGTTQTAFGRSPRRMVKATMLVSTKRLGVEPPIEELYRVLLHETGHALGLLGHSPYPRDVMYFTLTDDGPVEISDRDRRTLGMFY